MIAEEKRGQIAGAPRGNDRFHITKERKPRLVLDDEEGGSWHTGTLGRGAHVRQVNRKPRRTRIFRGCCVVCF